MAFSVASLGPFLAFCSLFLLPIPRVAGSMRTIRRLASDIHPISELEHVSIGNSSVESLVTRSPGLFLDLDIPRNTFLLKVYGHKRAGASLFGVCMDCNGEHGTYWTVDGHNASISTSFESTPSCLFSLALEELPTNHLVELHNSYDRRFGAHGKIMLSFVEYAIQENGNASFVTPTTDICETHLRRPDYSDILSRRGDGSNDESSSTKSSSSSSPRGKLGGKMDVMIGLIGALIAIVLIFIVAVLYTLHLRNKERLCRLGRDPEGGGSGSKSNPLCVSGKTESRTVVSSTETTPEEKQPGGQDELPSKSNLKEQRMTGFTSSSFSTEAQADSTKLTHDRLANPETNIIASRQSRLHGTQPPTSPPKEPIPDLPDPPVVPSHTPILSKGSNDDLFVHSSPASSPVQSRMRQADYSRSQPSPIEGSQRSQGIKYSENTLESNNQRHLPNGSGSGGSQTSHEGRFTRKPRPPSRILPPLPTPPLPQPLPNVIDPSTRTGPPLNRGQYTDSSSWSSPKKQASSRLQAGPIIPMKPIRESFTGSNPDPSSPERVKVSPKVTHEKTKSAEDVRHKARSQDPALRGAKSSPELEQPHPSKGVPLGMVTQFSGVRNHGVPKQDVRQTSSSRGDRESVRPPAGMSPPQMNLTLEISTGPDLGNMFTPSHEATQIPSAGEENVPFEISRATRMQVGNQRMWDAGGGGDRNNPRSQIPVRRDWPPPQPPSYGQTSPILLPVPPPTIAPLSPRKRALPKPPT